MKYFSMFSGIGGFEIGIQRAVESFNRNKDGRSQEDKAGNEGPRFQSEEGEEANGTKRRLDEQLNRNNDEGTSDNKTTDMGISRIEEREVSAEDEECLPDISSKDGGRREQCALPECVGFSEIDKYAVQIYKKHFGGHKNYGDATKIKPEELPDFDLLVGGFPCQSFSIAGKRRGFEDTRGTMFFEIARVLKGKQPRMFVLENVKGLLNHDGGNTFTKILQTIDELGYDAEWQILNSKHFGVPQNRERVFIVGYLRGTSRCQVFPITGQGSGNHGQNLDNDSKIISGTWRTHKDGEGFRELKVPISPCIPARAREDGSGQPCVAVLTPNRQNRRQEGRRFKEDGEPSFTLTGQDIYGVMLRDGRDNRSCLRNGRTTEVGYEGKSIRRLTPVECERLQGFPDNWTAEGIERAGHPIDISDTQRYKTLGNAVTTKVITAIVERMLAVDVFCGGGK